MLDDEKKKELLKDAESRLRREHFRHGKESGAETVSLDEYLSFLQDIQKIFKPFTISRRLTSVRFNKL